MNNKINFPYNDEFQHKMESNMINIFNEYSKTGIDKKIPIIIEEIYMSSNAIYKKSEFPLIKYKIQNNKIIYNKNLVNIYENLKDMRYTNNYDIIKKTLNWCLKNNLPIPNTTLYIWISDRFPWYTENLHLFPIFVYARPLNIQLPIFPDNTFECLQMSAKYSGECYDWDSLKQIITEKCENKTDKLDVMYFKGTRTTVCNHGLREKLEKYTKHVNNTIPIKIDLNAWQIYEPIYNFCKYLYLLNLPGRYPWSNRLKYLFLMGSTVINVNVITINIKPKYKDFKYISFIDYVVDKKDFIEIIYKYYRVAGKYQDDIKLIDKANTLNNKEFEKFIITLTKTYQKLTDNPKKYIKIANKAKEKVLTLTNERIYQYIYKCLLYNSIYLS